MAYCYDGAGQPDYDGSEPDDSELAVIDHRAEGWSAWHCDDQVIAWFGTAEEAWSAAEAVGYEPFYADYAGTEDDDRTEDELPY